MPLQNAVRKGATKNQNITVTLQSLTGHHKGTTGSLHLYHATFRKTDQQPQEQKRKGKKKKENAFFIIKRRNLKIILHIGNKSWIPSQNNYPRLTFPFSRNRNLNTFPSPRTREWKGSHQTPQRIPCLHSALEYPISFQMLCQIPETTQVNK